MSCLRSSSFALGGCVPAGVGNAGGLMVPNAHKSAPGTPHPGEKWQGRMRAANPHPKAHALELQMIAVPATDSASAQVNEAAPEPKPSLQQHPMPSLYARAKRVAHKRARTNPAGAECHNRSTPAHRTSEAKCDARASTNMPRASGSPNAVGTGLSSAAAGGSGWRMFEAQPSLRQTRLLRAAQGTAQRPCLRLAFSLVRFFWRSKRNELGRRAESRPAT